MVVVAVFVIVVRMVVVLWDGFRYASYLSVVCLESFPALQQDIHLLLSRIHAFIYCFTAFMHTFTVFLHIRYCGLLGVYCLALSYSGLLLFTVVVLWLVHAF